jgi:predicted amidohydrolase
MTMAIEAKVYLVGGSIPELEPYTNNIYNTSLTFNPDGELLATHRKMHLFDINIPGKITFRESDVLSAGEQITVVNLPGYGKVGIGICYDIRFTELSMIAARHGCFALIYPAAFGTTTGPLHWELQARARAMDNQVYTVLCSPARNLASNYHAWGHSMIVDPNAQVLTEAGIADEICSVVLQPGVISQAREGIPLTFQRRFDVYPDVSRGFVQVPSRLKRTT